MTFEFNLKGGAIAAMAITVLVSALLIPLPVSAQNTKRIPLTCPFRRRYGPETLSM